MASCTCNVRNGDPTRTITARNRAAAAFKRKFMRVKRIITESIVLNDAFGLEAEPQTEFARIVLQEAAQPGQFANVSLGTQVDLFDAWVEDVLNEELLEVELSEEVPTEPEEGMWFEAFIIAAFLRGMRRGRTELARIGKETEPYTHTTLPRVMLTQPGVKDQIDFILARTFKDIKNVSSATRAELRRVLAASLAEGVAPREMARRINKAIDEIGTKRGMLIARTEVIAAHHLALIHEYRQAGVLGIQLVAEWLTAGDGRVCARCNALAKKDNGYGPGIYTLDQVQFMIPVHPQCRCMALPKELPESEG